METLKFETGNIYQMKFIGDSNLLVKYVCLSRTAKKITFGKVGSEETISRMVKVYDNIEYVLEGNYSMAPIIKADIIVG
jgi:hypothetical protein